MRPNLRFTVFVNHKEVEDLTQEDIESALSVLKDQIDGAYTKEDLVKLLQVYGMISLLYCSHILSH